MSQFNTTFASEKKYNTLDSVCQERTFKVTYIKNDAVHAKDTHDLDEAKAWITKIEDAKGALPWCLECTLSKPAIILDCSANWKVSTIKAVQELELRAKIEELLRSFNIDNSDVEKLLDVNMHDLSNAVISRNYKFFEELDLITSVYVLIRVLKPHMRLVKEPAIKQVKFTRLTLNNFPDHANRPWIADTIRKRASAVEAKAIELGGKDAIVHVISAIDGLDETEDIGVMLRVQELREEWEQTVDNGLRFKGEIYRPLGRGTNADKEVKSLWVKEDILDEMLAFVNNEASPLWKVTESKKAAYQTGLKATCGTPIPLVFVPEDVIVLPDLYNETDVARLHYDTTGAAKVIRGLYNMIRTDGSAWIDIEERQVPEYVNRLVATGVDADEAERRVRSFMKRNDFSSIRSDTAAIKAGCDKNFKVHGYLRYNGISELEDAYGNVHNIADKSIFITESVLKTPIGPDGAYATFAKWCDAVRDGFNIKELVREHKLTKKHLSYQVLQALCEASDENVSDYVKHISDILNATHNIEGATKLLNGEMRLIAEHVPSIMGVSNVQDKAEHVFYKLLDEAFAGKMLKAAYYTFDAADPIWCFQNWAKLPVTGMLQAGTFHCGAMKFGEYAKDRSPVINPNSIRVLENVKIPKEFVKFFRNLKANVAYQNALDDAMAAMDEDLDGDHGTYIFVKAIIAAAKATLAKWDMLVTWDEPKVAKHVVTKSGMKDYWKSYINRSNLGLTMYAQNALYNGLKLVKDRDTKKTKIVRVNIGSIRINRTKQDANMAVDKNRADAVTKAGDSDDARYMIQPLAKVYRDKVMAHCNLSKEVDITAPEYREVLDKAAVSPDALLRYKPLNKYFSGLCDNIDRKFHIDDLPQGKFDMTVLMYDPEKSRRGLKGLIRNGKAPLVEFGGLLFRPDQGLFNYIADRIERDRKERNDAAESAGQKLSESEFRQQERVQALSELMEFANAMGRSIEDVHDVITWQMFEYADTWFTPETAFVRDRLWQAYWIIFGGMAVDAMCQNLGIDAKPDGDNDEYDDDECDE